MLISVYCFVSSYKEDSEDETDSDDLVEYDEKQTDVPTEPVETIEKVMRHRKGRPEGMLVVLHNG